MSNKIKWCNNCQRKVKAYQESNEQGCFLIFGHLIMCVLTGLLWLPIWILTVMCSSNKYFCPHCNEVVK